MFALTDSLEAIENKLRNAFANITWIGELALSQRDFQLIRDSMRTSIPRSVPPRVLLTTMVFCARNAVISDDENINFWSKFFTDVLKKPRTQSLENDYRDAFKVARALLQAAHGFEFPTRETTTTEVVSGVYQHAILPTYLQDDFAKFFLKQYPNQAAWSALDALFPDEIAAHNERAILNPPIPTRLIRFLQNSETSITAARLIKTLVTAAMWHDEGQTGEAIASVLSPIEQAVWLQLLPLLPAPDIGKVPTRASVSRVRWAWLIDQNDILELHVKNLNVSGDTPPDRLVWLNKADGATVRIGERVPEYERHYCEVNAYRASGGYTIDSAILIDIDEAGDLVAVDMQDHALNLPVPTDTPPTHETAFFRLQPDGQLAILSEIALLTDGDYAISLPNGVKLQGIEGGLVTHRYPLMVPKALQVHGHTSAARYSLKLPIQVGDRRIDKRRSRIAPTLDGAIPVDGLIPGALPIYEHGDLWLHFEPPTGVPLERLFIRLTADDVKVRALSDLDAAGQVTREDVQGQVTLRVRLNNYLPMTCLVQAELFSGVSRMHGDPRLAGLLPPGVRIIASPKGQYYTPSAPPIVRIEGVGLNQVELASDAQIDADDAGVTVTGIDPRQDAALRLKFGTTVLPLTFDVKWSFAWVSPLNGHFLWEDSLDEAMLSVRGEREALFYIAVAGGTPRTYTLNARGVMDVRIREDALNDMLRLYQGERALVQAWFARSGERIDLFTFMRPQFSDFERQPEIVKGAIRAFKQHLRHGRRDERVTNAYLLPALPLEYSASLPAEALPLTLRTLASIAPGSHNLERAALLPEHTWLLRLSDTAVYPLHRDETGISISIDRYPSRGADKVIVRVEHHEGGIALSTASEHLFQCMRCSDLYWSDEREAKLRHGHGQFGVEGRSIKDAVIKGHIVRAPTDPDTVRAFSPDFEPFIDRTCQAQFRIREPSKARRVLDEAAAKILTKPAYVQVTAHWVVRLRKEHQQVEQSLRALYKSHLWVDQLCIEMSKRDDPALIIAGRWISDEAARRNPNDWQMLDPVVMALAVTARAYAHQTTDLFSQKDTYPITLTLLEHAYLSCPELLTWALTWAELIFTHWKDEDTL